MMNSLENVCPVCLHKNELEAVVCGQCGTTLDDPFMDPGAKTKTTDMPALVPEKIRELAINVQIGEATVPDHGIALYVEGVADPIHVDANGEFVIGRRVGTTSEGLLDLSPLGGYHMGLSRRHAVIRRTEQGYELLDLGSVNGSWLNEEKMIPHKSYPLPSGAHLRFGRMRLFVLYRPFTKPR